MAGVEKSSVSPTPGFGGQEEQPAKKATSKEQAFTAACVHAVKKGYVTKSKNRCWFGAGWGSGISSKLAKAGEAGFQQEVINQAKNLTAENIRFLTPDQIRKLAPLKSKINIDFHKAFLNTRDAARKEALLMFLDAETKKSVMKDAFHNLKTDQDRKEFSTALMQMDSRERVDFIKSLQGKYLQVDENGFTAPKSLSRMTPEILGDFCIAIAELWGEKGGEAVYGDFFDELTKLLANPEVANPSERVKAVVEEFTKLGKADLLRKVIADDSFIVDIMQIGKFYAVVSPVGNTSLAAISYEDANGRVGFNFNEEGTPTRKDLIKLQLIFQMKEQLNAWTDKEKELVKPRLENILRPS